MVDLWNDTFVTFSELALQRLNLTLIHSLEWLLHKEDLNLTGQTPHDVIYQDDLLSLRHYKPLTDKEIYIGKKPVPVSRRTHPVPLVYIPPLLAPGFAFDLFPERSLVRYFLARGFDVYLVDFGSPDKSHSHLTFEHYVLKWLPDSFKIIRQKSGSRDLSLFGYCMGGLFCLLYTSITQDKNIRNIVTVASPIDMHQMGAAGKFFSLVALPAHKLASRLHISVRDIDPRFLHIPGVLGTFAFHLTNPLGIFKSHWDLLLHMWDRDYLVAQESLGHWINNLLDYPGATMQEIIVQMALGNRLVRKGSMTIGNHEAMLKHIQCSILAFAGTDDKIVPVHSAHKILDVVSSDDKEFHVVPGGHVGLIIGRNAPDFLWDMSAAWLAHRSQ